MRTLHKHGILGILFFRIPTVHGLQRDSILENNTAKMPWFVNISLNLKMYLYSLKICLIINLDDGKLAKTVNNVRTPPFSSGIWKRCCPRASKTALGLRPRAVLETLGRHLFQSPSKKGGVLAQNRPRSSASVRLPSPHSPKQL